MSDAERRSAIVLFDDYAAGLHRYLARRAGGETAADVLVDTLLSPAAADDRIRLFGIATSVLRDRVESHEPDDPLSGALTRLPAGQRDALLLTAWGRMEPDELATALGVAPDAAASLLRAARDAVGAGDDAGLDGALAAFRSDRRSDAATLAALRERVGREAVRREAVRREAVGPDTGRVPAAGGPGPAAGSTPATGGSRRRIRWRPVAAAAALLVVPAGALAAVRGAEPVAPQPATASAPASTPPDRAAGEVLAYTEWTLPEPARSAAAPRGARLPVATGPVSELGVTLSDPPVRPGQYLYRRIERGPHREELWIPAETGAEWMLRDSTGFPGEQRAVDGRFAHPPSSSALAVPDLSTDPSRNHTLLRVATGVALDPQAVALGIVIDTLKYRAVPGELRSALIGALAFVPGLRVTTEDGGDTTVISVVGRGSGRGARTDLLLDTGTGQVVGDRYAGGQGSFATRVVTGVADEIGVPPAGT